MRFRAVTIAAIMVIGLGGGLTACGEKDDAPAATATPTKSAAPATEVVEIAPFTDDGELADGWTLDESTLQSGAAISADSCVASEHGAGENTVSCGSTADALSACWLTERSDQIACLSENAVEEQTLRLIQLDGSAPETTEAQTEALPLWLKLEDGSTFLSVNGGAFSPPEGYYVAYTRIDGGAPDRSEEILTKQSDASASLDRGSDMWTVAVGGDGEGTDTIETREVERAWVLAGRELPEKTQADSNSSTPTPESFNGRWCEAPQSRDGSLGCVSIAYPNYTIESTGQTWPFADLMEQDGSFTLITADAPFGTYYPAGTDIPADSLMGVQDSPEEDRLWSSQSGAMLFRE